MMNSKISSYCFSLLCLIFSGQALAHNNNLATFYIVQSANDWVLEAHIARGTVDYAYVEERGTTEKVNSDQLKLWLVNHLMQSVNIVDNQDSKANLSILSASMGGHQCSIKFLVSGLSPQLTELDVNLDSFSVNPQHTNIVRVFYRGTAQQTKHSKLKKALKNSNQYQHTFELSD